MALSPDSHEVKSRASEGRFGSRALLWLGLTGAFFVANPSVVRADPEPAPVRIVSDRLPEVLDPAAWKALDAGTDRGLEYLCKHQRSDGSFEAPPVAQPGITSLCVLALLSRGHVPHKGTYGKAIDRAIENVLATQRESGVLFRHDWDTDFEGRNSSVTGAYNHAIAGLMLAEVYGMTKSDQRDRIRRAVQKAVRFTRERQRIPKGFAHDAGGWRYFPSTKRPNDDADLSVSAWNMMFLYSARNAAFDIPIEYLDEGIEFVRRMYVPEQSLFAYSYVYPGHDRQQKSYLGGTRATAASGILLLSLAGERDSETNKAVGEWILKNPLDHYNHVVDRRERFHYSAYYCSQAMFQLGGDYWKEFYPPLMRTLLKNQHPDGSWDPESSRDHDIGSVYTTALSVLALTPPYQLLPIYQR